MSAESANNRQKKLKMMNALKLVRKNFFLEKKLIKLYNSNRKIYSKLAQMLN